MKDEPVTKSKMLRFIFGSIAVVVVSAGMGFLVIKTWLEGNVVEKDNYKSLLSMVGQSDKSSQKAVDETIVRSDAIDQYTVAANLPRVLRIDKIGVKARILPMGVTEANEIQAPSNIFDSGWYAKSARPGLPGVAFIDAHASGPTREGLFAYIDTLQPVDKITIERGDGKVLNYEVDEVEILHLDQVDMGKVLSLRKGATEGLVLMTCTGKWMADAKTYNQRAIVYATRVRL